MTISDPRVSTATSVRSENSSHHSEQLRITSTSANSQMFTLPWSIPLAQWPARYMVDLPRGISRHIVRFVRVGSEIYAMKEISQHAAEREYEVLRKLEKLEIPCVQPVAIVAGRRNAHGSDLDSIMVTKHLQFSLPYRALFAQNLRNDTAERLIDALAVLLVRLHLVGFYWGDVSLSNVLFRRDADSFAAFLVDAETGELYEHLSEGRRHYDIDIARTNIIGELMDLNSGNLLPGKVDELAIGDLLVERYNSLWAALTEVQSFRPDQMWKIEERVNHLNDLGFDVGELEMKTSDDGRRVQVKPMVVDAGYASRKLLRLTGLDVQENQARRLLNDLETYRASKWRKDDTSEMVAIDWMREVFEPTIHLIPQKYRRTVEPAQFFHDVLTHRWFMAQHAGHDIPMVKAAADYIETVLPTVTLDATIMSDISDEADSGVLNDDDETGIGHHGKVATRIRTNFDSSDSSHYKNNQNTANDGNDDAEYGQDAAVWAV